MRTNFVFTILSIVHATYIDDISSCESIVKLDNPNISFKKSSSDPCVYRLHSIGESKSILDYPLRSDIVFTVYKDHLYLDNLYTKAVREDSVEYSHVRGKLVLDALKRASDALQIPLKLTDGSDLKWSFLLKFGETFYEKNGLRYDKKLSHSFRELFLKNIDVNRFRDQVKESMDSTEVNQEFYRRKIEFYDKKAYSKMPSDERVRMIDKYRYGDKLKEYGNKLKDEIFRQKELLSISKMLKSIIAQEMDVTHFVEYMESTSGKGHISYDLFKEVASYFGIQSVDRILKSTKSMSYFEHGTEYNRRML